LSSVSEGQDISLFLSRVSSFSGCLRISVSLVSPGFFSDIPYFPGKLMLTLNLRWRLLLPSPALAFFGCGDFLLNHFDVSFKLFFDAFLV